MTTVAEAAVELPAGAAGAGGPQDVLPNYGGASAASKIFNPDIAVIGNFLGDAGHNAVNPVTPLEMTESEVSFQAVVDPYARADFFVSFGQEGAGLEEGFITFPAIPGGLVLKVGMMKGAFGKVSTLHPHVLPWTDRPLVIDNLVGGEEGLSDSGVSVARLVPNPWVFLEATGQVFRGDSGVFMSSKASDLAYVGHLRGYGDLTESSNLDLGVWYAHGHNDAGPGLVTDVYGFDATFRYRPLRRAIYRSFLGRSEVIWSRRDQPDRAPGLGRVLRVRRVSVRAPLVRRRPLRSIGPPGRSIASRHGSVGDADLPGERVQSGTRAVSPDALRRGDDGQRVPLSVSVLDRGAWGAPVLGRRRFPMRLRIAAGISIAVLALRAPALAESTLSVVTSTEDLASIAREVGGDRVEVQSIARGYQDPHYVEAKPSFILRLQRADLLVAIGRDLEIGWLPPLIQQSRNARIHPGADGYLDASLTARVLDIPTGPVTRAMGDVHPLGNPHYWLEPENGRRMARAVLNTLARLRPADRAYFEQREADFERRLTDAEKRWDAAMAPFRGTKLVTYHRSFPNFADCFGLERHRVRRAAAGDPAVATAHP